MAALGHESNQNGWYIGKRAQESLPIDNVHSYYGRDTWMHGSSKGGNSLTHGEQSYAHRPKTGVYTASSSHSNIRPGTPLHRRRGLPIRATKRGDRVKTTIGRRIIRLPS
eukprot:scaffold25972_cov32-Tisochrysis_lutea.AAC.10